jgi:hypothetical protein
MKLLYINIKLAAFKIKIQKSVSLESLHNLPEPAILGKEWG